MPIPWITILTALPMLGGCTVLALGRRNSGLARWVALGFSLASLLVTLLLWRHFDCGSAAMQFEERHLWIQLPMISAEYRVGIDGLGLLMLLLSAIVTPMSILASFSVNDRPNLYFSLILFLQACLFGTFTALNFFHWFIFWELGLVPAFFLIRLWGGARSGKAATQFLIYTLVGSVTLLLSFVALFTATRTFDFLDLATLSQQGKVLPAMLQAFGLHHVAPPHLALLIFAGAFLGFAVKVPLMPFHTWLKPAYTEAPCGTTMLLTGAMSKMGLYGMLRIILPIFAPQMRELLTPLLWLAVATIVFSALAALAQTDLKAIFAYSSINHLGYCLLALFAVVRFTGQDAGLAAQKAAAIDGVLLQMFNHGLTAAALFWFVALLERRSGGLRGLHDFGGLRKVMPVFTGLMGIALFSSLGLPGLNGFVGEFLIFKGLFPLAPWAASISVLGLLITAVFVLGILQHIFSGPLNDRWKGLVDLSIGERIMLFPVLGVMFALGLYPQLLLGFLNSTVLSMVQHLQF
jgi:NADH-quinone oxidoreductase subunit M